MSSSSTISSVVSKFLHEYGSNTSKRLKAIDAYLLYVVLTGVMQFVYCSLVGTFPFNAFLSGFISCVGSFVLGVCLRLQVNVNNGI
jgi:oligosaccharyltransferase complex subunit epsilon